MYLSSLRKLLYLSTAQLQYLLLGLILQPNDPQQTHIPASDDITLHKTKIIFSHNLIFVLMDILPL
jgi:hypothetical protein